MHYLSFALIYIPGLNTESFQTGGGCGQTAVHRKILSLALLHLFLRCSFVSTEGSLALVFLFEEFRLGRCIEISLLQLNVPRIVDRGDHLSTLEEHRSHHRHVCEREKNILDDYSTPIVQQTSFWSSVKELLGLHSCAYEFKVRNREIYERQCR